MSTDQLTSSPEKGKKDKKSKKEKDADGTKSSFWTLKRTKEDATAHPPFAPTLPHVNLLPSAITDSIMAGKLRRWFILGALLIAAIVAGVWYLQSSQISNAEEALKKATAENAQLQKSVGDLAPVKEMYGQITRLQDIVTTTMAAQPEAAVVLDQLAVAGAAAARGGKPVTFSSVDVQYSGIPDDPRLLNSCPNPDPFTTDITIGCVTFTATAANREQVSELLRVLEADPLFTGPFVTTTSISAGDATTGSADEVVFSGTAGVALDALKTKLTPEQITAITTPPKPTPSPSASASGAAS